MEKIPESITFNGVEYRLMGAKRYYLSQAPGNRDRKGAKSLHVAIWEFYNEQEVPEGYSIHHKDGNPFNNDIANLECIPIKQHLSIHSRKNWENEEYRRRGLKQLREAREKAKEWHQSPEGRKWHSEHGKKVARNMPDIPKVCKQCGKEYMAKRAFSQFCCDRCGEIYRGRNRRVKYAGVCVVCGGRFEATKWKPSARERETCSKACANRLNHQRRKEPK